MFAKTVAVCCVYLLLVANFSLGQQNGGLLSSIYDQLSPEQKQELDQIVQSASSGIKGEFRSRIDEFVSRLSEDLKRSFQQPNDQYNAFKLEIEQRVKTISPSAQQIFFGLKSIVEDDNISFSQGIRQIDQSGLNELQQNQIPLPGIPPPSQFFNNQ